MSNFSISTTNTAPSTDAEVNFSAIYSSEDARDGSENRISIFEVQQKMTKKNSLAVEMKPLIANKLENV